MMGFDPFYLVFGLLLGLLWWLARRDKKATERERRRKNGWHNGRWQP